MMEFFGYSFDRVGCMELAFISFSAACYFNIRSIKSLSLKNKNWTIISIIEIPIKLHFILNVLLFLKFSEYMLPLLGRVHLSYHLFALWVINLYIWIKLIDSKDFVLGFLAGLSVLLLNTGSLITAKPLISYFNLLTSCLIIFPSIWIYAIEKKNFKNLSYEDDDYRNYW